MPKKKPEPKDRPSPFEEDLIQVIQILERLKATTQEHFKDAGYRYAACLRVTAALDEVKDVPKLLKNDLAERGKAPPKREVWRK